MSSFQPPLYNSDVFNSSLFNYDDETPLTVYDGDRRYLKISGGVVNGFSTFTNGLAVNNGLTLDGNLVNLNVISGITPGTVSASKALVVDANKDIGTINTLTANSIYGTLQTAAQPNITSLGTLSSLNITNGLSASTLTGTLQTAAQPNITSLGTLSTLNLNGSFNFGSNANTTMNNNLIITGSASSPTTTNGIGFAFNPIISTGRIKAYNYAMSNFNNITINEGAIYVKADKTVSINKETNSGYALDVNGDISSNGSWRNGSTILMNNSGVLQNPTQLNITKTAHNAALNLCGFEDKTQSSISYDAPTRIFTLTPTGASYIVWVAGTRYVISSTLTTSAHATTKGVGYYVYIDTNGTLVISSNSPDLTTVAMVSYIYYYDVSNTLFLEERHGCTMDPETHRQLHLTQGTYYLSGLTLSGYTLNGSTDANNTFSSSSGVISDEDLRITISAVADGGSYTTFYMDTANSDWRFGFSKSLPYNNGATYIQYNQWTGSVWQLTELATNNWVCYYVVYTPSVAVATQMVLIPGQSVYTSLASAQAESFYNLSTSSLNLPEFLPLYQLIFRTSAGYTTTGKCRLEAVNRIVGNKAIITGSSASNHQALSGLQLAASGNTYGHIDDSTQTIAGAKTLSGITTVSNTTDSSAYTDGAFIVSGGVGIAKKLYVNSGIYGTIQTAAQANITSVGTLTSLDIANSLTQGTTSKLIIRDNSTWSSIGTTTDTNLAFICNSSYIGNWTTTGLRIGDGTNPSYRLDVNGDISLSGSLRNGASVFMNSSGVLSIAAQTNITSVGTLSALTIGGNLTLSENSVLKTNSITGLETDNGLLVTKQATRNTGKGIQIGYDSTGNKGYIGSYDITNNLDKPLYINGLAIYISAAGNVSLGQDTLDTNKFHVVGNIHATTKISTPYLQLGTSTDTTRQISALTGGNSVITFGAAASDRRQAELLYTDSSGDLTACKATLGFYGSGYNKILTVQSNKRVGINNNSPGYDLDVNGDVNLTGALKMDGSDVIDSSYKFIGVGIDTTARITMRQDGYGLSLRGHSSYTSKEFVSHVDSTGWSIGAYSNDNLKFITNNTARMGISGTSSDVWIGSDSTSAYAKLYIESQDTYQYSIHCKGGFDVQGIAGNSIVSMLYSSSSLGYSSSWTGTHKVAIMVEDGGIQVNGYHIASYSDRRKKEDIYYYDNLDNDRIINGINNINIASFVYKKNQNKALGVIAQDLALNGLVECITLEQDDTMKIEGEGDINGFAMSIDYSKIGIYLIPYVKKLNARIELLESEIKFLQNK